jgi:hypothetical protein
MKPLVSITHHSPKLTIFCRFLLFTVLNSYWKGKTDQPEVIPSTHQLNSKFKSLESI